jgi:hypothetical protein
MSGAGYCGCIRPETEYSSSLRLSDHGRVHRKQIVLAGLVDMQMGVADEADVAHAHAVARELVLDHVLVELKPRMPSVPMIWLER